MDSETLLKFAQSVGISSYSKAKDAAKERSRDKFMDKLLEDSGVTNRYKTKSDLEKAMRAAGIYFKF